MWGYLVDIDADPLYFKLAGILVSNPRRFINREELEQKLKVPWSEIKPMLENMERWGLLIWSETGRTIDYQFMARRAKSSLFDVPQDPIALIVELYHKYCPSCRKVRRISRKRRAIISARWREYPDKNFWIEFFKRVEASDFLTGRTGSFKADLEWLLTEKNFVKVLEGRYDNPKREEVPSWLEKLTTREVD